MKVQIQLEIELDDTTEAAMMRTAAFIASVRGNSRLAQSGAIEKLSDALTVHLIELVGLNFDLAMVKGTGLTVTHGEWGE